MIDKMQFLEGIGKIANLTNTTPPEGIGLWYEKFKHWKLSEWQSACDACGSELKWFPRVADIIERKPKRYSTGAIKTEKTLTGVCIGDLFEKQSNNATERQQHKQTFTRASSNVLGRSFKKYGRFIEFI